MGTKLVIVIFACLFCARADFHNISFENVTHIVNDSFYDVSVVKALNKLVYVSYLKINADTFLKLESAAIPNNICEIKIKIPQERDLLSPEAVALGNGKVVVAFVEEELNFDEGIPDPLVMVYVIDLKNNCSNDFFAILFDIDILTSVKSFSLIPYQDSFDIFAKSKMHCSPPDSICMIRHSDEGSFQRSFNFDFPTSQNRFDLESIQPIREFDPQGGYVYFSKHTSTVRALDSNFKVVAERQVNGYVVTHSVLNGDVAVCSHADEHTECLKLDSKLEVKANVSLAHARYFAARRIYNLADGSSLFVRISLGRVNTMVRRLREDGKLSQPEYYQYECESLLTDPVDKFFELDAGVYCFSFECKLSTITHCVNSTEAENLLNFS